MAETCIVCLGDLRTSSVEDPSSDAPEAATIPAAAAAAADGDDPPLRSVPKQGAKTSTKSLDDDDEIVAHLLPCKHNLHNACLKPWVERANSCPICRSVFNMVELTQTVGGSVLDSYVVQDKVQQAEIDPSMVVEDELFAIEPWELCMVCGAADERYEFMYCDGCDKAIHAFCAGFNDSPEVWYCRTCLVDLEREVDLPGVASALERPARRRTAAAHGRGRRRRSNDALWARVWQEVSRRLDLDLDFPFDDWTDERTEEQRREFQQWERRLQIGSTQGATERLRDIAEARLRPVVAPPPESQEVIRAWNAFDKARESEESPQSSRRRKRRPSASPTSPAEAESSEQPQLKRPRLRRRPLPLDGTAPDAANVAESSASAANRADSRSTFLSSLLRDVENKVVSAGSPTASEHPTGAFSPRNSSPVRSPNSSGHVTPRALSVTPPPQRPMSPPLSSTIIPMPVPVPASARFSPYSPADSSPNGAHGFDLRGRQRDRRSDDGHRNGRAASSSPTGTLSYSAKEELQRMVKMALGSRYRDKEISKDQYTDINRDVSRKLYDLVGDASALGEQKEREKWQGIADAEVRKAIAALTTDEESS